MENFYAAAKALAPYTVQLRRDFHAHPEIGFQEVRTAGVVARELTGLGLEVMTGVAKTGVVAILDGGKPGTTILARFDMDALPIVEQTGADYASKNPGIMHACGHDAHVAIGLTVAKILTENRERLHGKVKFIFQPAEEGLGGAKAMISAGILNDPQPAASLGLHVWSEKPVGWIGIPAGPMMAGNDKFVIRLTGKGGHGAMPHQAIDSVLAGSNIVVALQQIVSRNVSPFESAVVSVTQFQAGETFTIISQTAELKGTIRTFSAETRKIVHERLTTIVHGCAGAYGCAAEIEIEQSAPAVINDHSISDVVADAISSALTDSHLDRHYQTSASEDMAYILEKIPGCFFFVGASGKYPHHHPKFDISEDALVVASTAMASAISKLLSLSPGSK